MRLEPQHRSRPERNHAPVKAPAEAPVNRKRHTGMHIVEMGHDYEPGDFGSGDCEFPELGECPSGKYMFLTFFPLLK